MNYLQKITLTSLFLGLSINPNYIFAQQLIEKEPEKIQDPEKPIQKPTQEILPPFKNDKVIVPVSHHKTENTQSNESEKIETITKKKTNKTIKKDSAIPKKENTNEKIQTPKIQKNDTDSVNNKQIQNLILHTIANGYRTKGWEKKSIQFNQSLEVTIGTTQFKELINHNLCLKKDKKIIVAIPLSSIQKPINSLTEYIVNKVYNAFPSHAVTIIWFNKKGQLWEMYFPQKIDATQKKVYLWVLDNKEIKPTKLSKNDENKITSFLNYPF